MISIPLLRGRVLRLVRMWLLYQATLPSSSSSSSAMPLRSGRRLSSPRGARIEGVRAEDVHVASDQRGEMGQTLVGYFHPFGAQRLPVVSATTRAAGTPTPPVVMA